MNFENVKYFMDKMSSHLVPGNSIEIYLKGKKVFRYSSGYADIENNVAMSSDKLINIYSCSKVMTITALMQLYEKGEFLLSDPLYEYIPEFKEMYVKNDTGVVKAQNPITIGDLFSMTAGLDYNIGRNSFKIAGEKTNGHFNTLETIKELAKEPLCYEPSTMWKYSLAHDVLAGLCEAITGKKFRDYVKENILDPLEMNDTCYHLPKEKIESMAQQYSFVPYGYGENYDLVEAQMSTSILKGKIVKAGKGVNTLVLGDEYDSGGAGIISTVRDYAKFSAALSMGGVGINKERILSPYTVELIKTNRLTQQTMPYFSVGRYAGYGYGLGVRTLVDKAKSGSCGNIGEFGWCGAAGGMVLCDTEIGLGVFYAHHMLNPHEDYYMPRLRNVIYSCLE